MPATTAKIVHKKFNKNGKWKIAMLWQAQYSKKKCRKAQNF